MAVVFVLRTLLYTSFRTITGSDALLLSVSSTTFCPQLATLQLCFSANALISTTASFTVPDWNTVDYRLHNDLPLHIILVVHLYVLYILILFSYLPPGLWLAVKSFSVDAAYPETNPIFLSALSAGL
jgi:hypothetical protein